MLAGGILTQLTALDVFVPAVEEAQFWTTLGGMGDSYCWTSTSSPHVRRWLAAMLAGYDVFSVFWQRLQEANGKVNRPVIQSTEATKICFLPSI